MTMHDYPKRGEQTTCCNRPRHELPLGEGMTSDPKGVTCDGTFEPAVFAHEIYPHPSEYADQPPTLEDAARYHLARTIALYPDDDLDDIVAWSARITLMLAERSIACLVVALHKELVGQEALAWAHWHSSGDDGEEIYDLAKEYGVELDRIKLYSLRSDKPAEVDQS